MTLVIVASLLPAVGVGIGAAMLALGVDLVTADGMARLNTRSGALAALSTFILWWVALAVAMPLLHRRSIASLFGGSIAQGLRPFAAGFALALGVAIISGVIGAAIIGTPVRGIASLSSWLTGVALAIPLLLIQTGAEEVLFRGYLLQQLAARFRSPLIWAVLPSALFGALHWNPAAPGDTLTVMIITGMAGLIFALMTAKTGGLGLAWGLHFGMNLSAILFVSPGDYFSGLALWHWPQDAAAMLLLVWIDLVFIALLLALVTLWALRPTPVPPTR